MQPLPLDFVRLGSLRQRVLWQLLAAPFIAALGAWPLIKPRTWTEQLIPYVETIGQLLATPPDKVAELALVMFTFCASAAAYLLGWCLNFLALSLSPKYSILEIKQALLHGKVPSSWEKDDAAERIQAKTEAVANEWHWAQQEGPFRYIVVRGGLVFGTMVFLGLHVLLKVVASNPIALESLPLKLALWILFGVVMNSCRWWALRRSSREA